MTAQLFAKIPEDAVTPEMEEAIKHVAGSLYAGERVTAICRPKTDRFMHLAGSDTVYPCQLAWAMHQSKPIYR